jgi:hypothetical protein
MKAKPGLMLIAGLLGALGFAPIPAGAYVPTIPRKSGVKKKNYQLGRFPKRGRVLTSIFDFCDDEPHSEPMVHVRFGDGVHKFYVKASFTEIVERFELSRGSVVEQLNGFGQVSKRVRII